jgi:predicted DNA repair protein MutK
MSRFSRGARALLATSFLFFLAYSAPHRVHHFFDQVQSAGQHDSTDHHNPTDHQNQSPKGSDCVFQISAARCVFGLAAKLHALALAPLVQAFVAFPEFDRQQQFLAAAFLIRAPPLA